MLITVRSTQRQPLRHVPLVRFENAHLYSSLEYAPYLLISNAGTEKMV